MNFMSYVAEFSRGWDEPNARDMGRMASQPNAKGEMQIQSQGLPTSTQFKRKKTLLLNLIKIKRVSMKWRLRRVIKRLICPHAS